MLKTLDAVYQAMKANDSAVLDHHNQWSSDLPTWGEGPSDTEGVWSWDAERMIVGTCADDLEIIER